MIGRSALSFLVVGFAVLAGCATETEVEEDSASDELNAGEGLTNLEAVARAKQWSDAKLQYCWAPNGGDNHKAGNLACQKICVRQKNPEWDPYRSDCSGLVSWAWGLRAPGRITTNFAPFQSDITDLIDAKDLRPGDAINNRDHIMLFKQWLEPGKKAVFIEEPGCGTAMPYARETTSDVILSGSTITVIGRDSFKAIRYKSLKVGDAAPKPDAVAPPTVPPQNPGAPAPPAPEEKPAPIVPLAAGGLDPVSCDGIKGWAMGPGSSTVDVELSFFEELGRPGSKSTRTAANVRRPELPAERAEFGFLVKVPLSARDGKEHPVSAYGADAKGNALRIDQPQKFTCPRPEFPREASSGARRAVSNATLVAWGMTEFDDVANEPEADAAKFELGPKFPAVRQPIKTADSPEIYVVDGKLRRRIAEADIQTWHLPATQRIVTTAELDAMAEGPAWPSKPFFFQTGNGDIFAIDEKFSDEVIAPAREEIPEDTSMPQGVDGQPDMSEATDPEGQAEDGKKPNKSDKKMTKIQSGGCSQHGSSPADMTGGALLIAASIIATRRRKKAS